MPNADRRLRPAAEGLEPRDLPSAGTTPRAAVVGRPRPAQAGDPGPTAGREIAFAARFVGPYRIARSNAADISRITSLQGGGTASAFHRGNARIRIATPADASEVPAGIATLFDLNFPNTGNVLSLELEGDPGSGRDGRPTALRWTAGEASDGSFSEATGEGTLTIRYRPTRPGAGVATAVFRGRLTVDPTANYLAVR